MSQRIQCPGCASQGGDTSCNNLVINRKGNPNYGWCFVCKKSYKINNLQMTASSRSFFDEGSRGGRGPVLDIGAISSYPIRALTHKPIPLEICERYQVRVSVREEDCSIDRVFCPYYDSNDLKTVIGYKIRTVPKGDFPIVGKVNSFFGMNKCKPKGKFILITEGEDDVLASATMFHIMGKTYNVASIPNGASESGTLDATTRKLLGWLAEFETVALALDKDKPGQETQKALADILCAQTKVKIVSLRYKDAGEYLKAGKAKEFYEDVCEAREYHPEAIVPGYKISLDEIMKTDEPGFSIPYPLLNKRLNGLRKGELTLLCAGSGVGKSTFTREIGYHLATQHDQTIANIYLETPMKDAVKSYIAIDNNIPLWKLKFQNNALPREQIESSYNKLIKSGRFHFFNHFGSLNPDKLIQQCRYFIHALHCDWIILDHLSMIFSGHESDNERKDIDKTMTSLSELVVQTGVGVLAVVHLKRVHKKNFNRGDEVEITDLRGSAGLEQLSSNIISIQRDTLGDSRDFSISSVLKNRTMGDNGICDSLKYYSDIGRLLTYDAGEVYG